MTSCASRTMGFALIAGAALACSAPAAPGKPTTPDRAPPQATPDVPAQRPTPKVVQADPPGGAVLMNRLLGRRGVNAMGIAVDSKGAMYVTGSIQGRTVFGDLPAVVSEGTDAFVLKLASSGEPVWLKRFGGSGPDSGQSVVVDAEDRIYVSGNFESKSIDFGKGPMTCAGIEDLFLAKLDAEGNVLWANRYGDALTQIDMHLRLHPAGGVVATGWHNGALDFGTGRVSKPWSKAFFAASIDADGKGRWAAAFGRRLDYAKTDSAVDSQGRVIVSAGSDATTELVEGTRPTAGSKLGPVLIAFDDRGKQAFGRRFGHGADNLSTAVAVDAKDGIRLAVASRGVTRFGDKELPAPSNGQTRLVVTSFDAKGAILWSKEALSGSGLSVAAAQIDAPGNTYVTGQLNEQLARTTRSNGFVVKLTPAGEVAWTRLVADGTRAWLSDIAFDHEGRIVVTGAVAGLDFQNQLYVAKLQP
jgi:hypothetical protein